RDRGPSASRRTSGGDFMNGDRALSDRAAATSSASHDAMRIIARLPSLHVLVIGESMLDRYLVGHSTRLCREAPAPIVDVTSRREAPGGAANTAANVRALGARVTLLTATGADREGDCLVEVLAHEGVDVEHVLRSPSRATLVKQRVIAGPQLIVRFDEGS